MYAVISTGGKQVKISEGSVIDVEKSGEAQAGDSFTFSDVLLLADGSEMKLGTPLVEKANVFGTVIDVHRAPKVLIFKKKRRKQYRRTKGHRQYLMRIRIDEMGLYAERKKQPEALPAAKSTAKPKSEPKPKAKAAQPKAKVAPAKAKAKAPARSSKKPAAKGTAAKPAGKTSKAPDDKRGKKR